jgi:hypothetical protein
MDLETLQNFGENQGPSRLGWPDWQRISSNPKPQHGHLKGNDDHFGIGALFSDYPAW